MEYRDDAPQQPYMGQPYQPPQPPKTSHRKRNITLGIVGGIIVIGVIGAATGGNKSSDNTAATSPTTAAPTSAEVPATTEPTTQDPTTAAPVKQVVFKLSGSGEESSTKTFTLTQPDYSVAYTYNCKNFGMQGNFIADVEQSGNDGFDDTVANALGMKGSNTVYFHDGPTSGSGSGIYLSINSECDWTVTVTDGDDGQ